jgi:hypothetical protein
MATRWISSSLKSYSISLQHHNINTPVNWRAMYVTPDQNDLQTVDNRYCGWRWCWDLVVARCFVLNKRGMTTSNERGTDLIHELPPKHESVTRTAAGLFDVDVGKRAHIHPSRACQLTKYSSGSEWWYQVSACCWMMLPMMILWCQRMCKLGVYTR